MEKTKEKKVTYKVIKPKANKREVAKIEAKQSPEALISQAIDKGTSVETMERLLAMRRELKAEFAKEQFDISMAEFQGECPVIKKGKPGGKTKSGVVAYYYAPLESIVEQVKDLIKSKGFSYMIKTETTEKGVKVYCIVKHMSGHSETSDIQVPLGTQTGVMSAPQVVASALTFAKRYAFCNAFGILTGDDDNDGKLDGAESVNKKEPIKKDPVVVAKTLIAGANDVGKLIDFEKRINEAKVYTEPQKKELIELIKSRADQIDEENKK